MQLGVALFCTSVKYPYQGDWKKLTRVIKYISSTIVLPLVIGIDDTNPLCWYVYTAFGLHGDMKSHTKMVMTMGQGAASSNSTKHKLNTKSSTEEELFVIDN